MKENVFHGSIVVGLKEIKPNESTQKDFSCVYATIYKELANNNFWRKLCNFSLSK